MSETKHILKNISIALAILIVFSLAYKYFPQGPLAKVKKQISSNEALVVFEDGVSKRYFAGEVKDNMTVLDAIKASDEMGKFGAEINDGRMAIRGKTDWLFYQNNSLLSQPLDKYIVKQGDIITIKEK